MERSWGQRPRNACRFLLRPGRGAGDTELLWRAVYGVRFRRPIRGGLRLGASTGGVAPGYIPASLRLGIEAIHFPFRFRFRPRSFHRRQASGERPWLCWKRRQKWDACL